MTTTDIIDLNDDAVFAREVLAFVRNEPNKIWLGTVAEEQAEIAQRLAWKDPSILEEADRLISAITSMHYVERGYKAQAESWADLEKRNYSDIGLLSDFCNDVAFRRHSKHTIRAGTVGETWAREAKRVAKRLLAAIRGDERRTESETPPRGWRIWNGRVNRACISDTEFRRRSSKRKTAGEAIEIATAEFASWHNLTLDPYDDMLPLLYEHDQYYGREVFCRAPEFDVWVNLGDLPEEKQEAAWKRVRDLARCEATEHQTATTSAV